RPVVRTEGAVRTRLASAMATGADPLGGMAPVAADRRGPGQAAPPALAGRPRPESPRALGAAASARPKERSEWHRAKPSRVEAAEGRPVDSCWAPSQRAWVVNRLPDRTSLPFAARCQGFGRRFGRPSPVA